MCNIATLPWTVNDVYWCVYITYTSDFSVISQSNQAVILLNTDGASILQISNLGSMVIIILWPQMMVLNDGISLRTDGKQSNRLASIFNTSNLVHLAIPSQMKVSSFFIKFNDHCAKKREKKKGFEENM